jgi:hypothetical protein
MSTYLVHGFRHDDGSQVCTLVDADNSPPCSASPFDSIAQRPYRIAERIAGKQCWFAFREDVTNVSPPIADHAKNVVIHSEAELYLRAPQLRLFPSP